MAARRGGAGVSGAFGKAGVKMAGAPGRLGSGSSALGGARMTANRAARGNPTAGPLPRRPTPSRGMSKPKPRLSFKGAAQSKKAVGRMRGRGGVSKRKRL